MPATVYNTLKLMLEVHIATHGILKWLYFNEMMLCQFSSKNDAIYKVTLVSMVEQLL